MQTLDMKRHTTVGNSTGAILRNVVAASIAAAMARGTVAAQAPGQNLDVVSWKQFPVAESFFYTNSKTLVPTNMSPSPLFVKQRSDTYLWAMCAIDFVPSTGNSCYHAIAVDGVPQLTVAMAGTAGQILTFSMTDLIGAPAAGQHEIKLYAAINNAESDLPAEWRTTVCSLRVFEITLPPPQV